MSAVGLALFERSLEQKDLPEMSSTQQPSCTPGHTPAHQTPEIASRTRATQAMPMPAHHRLVEGVELPVGMRQVQVVPAQRRARHSVTARGTRGWRAEKQQATRSPAGRPLLLSVTRRHPAGAVPEGGAHLVLICRAVWLGCAPREEQRRQERAQRHTGPRPRPRPDPRPAHARRVCHGMMTVH